MRGLWEMEDFVRRAQFTSGTFQGHFLGQSYIVCFCNCSLNVFRSILRRSNARGRYCCATTKRSRAAWKNWAWNTPRFSATKTIVRRLSGWCRSQLKTVTCGRLVSHQVPRLYLQHVSHAVFGFRSCASYVIATVVCNANFSRERWKKRRTEEHWMPKKTKRIVLAWRNFLTGRYQAFESL